MHTEYTAVVKQDGDWWIGWVEEVSGVNTYRLPVLVPNASQGVEIASVFPDGRYLDSMPPAPRFELELRIGPDRL